MGSLLGYGGVSFSVLVVAPGQLAGPNQRALLITASFTFVALCLFVAAGMWPRKVEAGASPKKLIGWIDVDEATPDEATRNLAEGLELTGYVLVGARDTYVPDRLALWLHA